MNKKEQKIRKSLKLGVGFEEEIVEITSDDESTKELTKDEDNKLKTNNMVSYPVPSPNEGFWRQYMKFVVLGGTVLFLIIIGLAILAIVA